VNAVYVVGTANVSFRSRVRSAIIVSVRREQPKQDAIWADSDGLG